MDIISKKILKGLSVIGGVGTIMLGSVLIIPKIQGEEVYGGKIDGYSIVYEEEKLSSRSGVHDPELRQNIMTLSKDGTMYVLHDIFNETPINWTYSNHQFDSFAQEFKSKESLEKVVRINGDDKQVYEANVDGNEKVVFDETTLEGKAQKEIFQRADALYNSMREKIRAQLRTDYQAKADKELSYFPDVKDQTQTAEVEEKK